MGEDSARRTFYQIYINDPSLCDVTLSNNLFLPQSLSESSLAFDKKNLPSRAELLTRILIEQSFAKLLIEPSRLINCFELPVEHL